MAGQTWLTCLQWIERQRGQWRQHDATLARAWCAAATANPSPAALPAPRSAGVDRDAIVSWPADVTQ